MTIYYSNRIFTGWRWTNGLSYPKDSTIEDCIGPERRFIFLPIHRI